MNQASALEKGMRKEEAQARTFILKHALLVLIVITSTDKKKCNVTMRKCQCPKLSGQHCPNLLCYNTTSSRSMPFEPLLLGNKWGFGQKTSLTTVVVKVDVHNTNRGTSIETTRKCKKEHYERKDIM